MSPSARRALIFGMLIAAIAALSLPRLLARARTGEPAAPAAPAAEEAVRVTVVDVAPQTLQERLATTGTLRANEQVSLVSQIAGKIESIHFQEGSQVERGDLLVEIEDAELVAERERAAYRVELAELRETRQRELREQGVTSQQEYDLAFNELAVLQAELQLVEAQLAKTEIRAPFSGVVGLRYVSEGAYLSPQTLIATLQDVDPIKIDFSVPEKYAGQVRVGESVLFRVKGAARQFSGSIFAIEPSVDAQTRSLVLRAVSPNQDLQLVPGAFADVELVVREVRDALAVPAIAVIPELGGKKVFVLTAAGTAEPRPVETGIRTDTLVEITHGLEAGDRVIATGIQQLRSGVPVVVVAGGLESAP